MFDPEPRRDVHRWEWASHNSVAVYMALAIFLLAVFAIVQTPDPHLVLSEIKSVYAEFLDLAFDFSFPWPLPQSVLVAAALMFAVGLTVCIWMRNRTRCIKALKFIGLVCAGLGAVALIVFFGSQGDWTWTDMAGRLQSMEDWYAKLVEQIIHGPW